MTNLNLTIKNLADKPEVLPTLAQWTYDAWSKYDPTLTMSVATESLKAKLNRDTIPLTFVAFSDETPVGTVSLKSQIKLKGYEDRKLWLGSFWVPEDYRNQGVGELLLEQAYSKARDLGHAKISLFASDPQAAAWYITKNWRKFATDTYQNHEVTLLEYDL